MIAKPLVEIAVEALDHAINAATLGADRIELCANLSAGGFTPSYGLIEACVKSINIPIYVMLRCRGGNFHYNSAEIELMLSDMEACSRLGASGVVFGCLNKDLSLDLASAHKLINRAKELVLKTTFHRAIDVCKNPMNVVERLAELGIDNLLTSGSSPKAIQGIDQIEKYINKFGNHINVIAGSGVNKDNVLEFISRGIRNVHFTSHKYITDSERSRFNFGNRSVFDKEFTIAILNEINSK